MTPSILDTATRLFEARLRVRIDPRITPCAVKVTHEGRVVRLSGFTARRQTDQFVRTLAGEVFPGRRIECNLRVLEAECEPAFYEVTAPHADFYPTARVTRKDLLTQPLHGTVLRGFHRQGGYLYAQHPDGYVGFVAAASVAPVDIATYTAWRNGSTARIKAAMTLGKVKAPPQSRLILGKGGVRLPGGGTVRLPRSAYTIIEPKPPGIARRILALADQYKGTPYLWGGNTHHGIDCSGFVQSIAGSLGVSLPRDASMQAYVGEITGVLPDRSDLLPGDVIFFMNEKAYIHHVGLYLGNQTYIHSSGKRGVNVATFNRAGSNFIEKYHDNYVFGRRLLLP